MEHWLSFWKSFQRDLPKEVLARRMEAYRKGKYPRKTGSFDIGDFVVLRTPEADMGPKGADKYQGPYKITG